MASAAARLLRRSFSPIPCYESVALSYSSLAASLQSSRFSHSASSTVKLPLAQLLHNPPFRSLAFCSAASDDKLDGDGAAAPELSMSAEEPEASLRSATASLEIGAGNDASPDPSRLAGERWTATESSSARFQQMPMKKGDWICPHCSFMNFARNFRCLECKTLRIRAARDRFDQVVKGDWTCPRCGFMNFSKNTKCLQCKADMPQSGVSNAVLKKGDWHCPECEFMNFAKNVRCLQCNASRPLKPGDWHCPKCQYLNFAGNSACRRCEEAHPENQGSNDWECPSCKHLNVERNVACLKCNLERPRKKSTGAHGSNDASHQNRDSLLFSDNLFGRSDNVSSSSSSSYSATDDDGDDDFSSRN